MGSDDIKPNLITMAIQIPFDVKCVDISTATQKKLAGSWAQLN